MSVEGKSDGAPRDGRMAPVSFDEDDDGYGEISCSTLMVAAAALGVGEILRGSGKLFSMAMRALGSIHPKADHVEL